MTHVRLPAVAGRFYPAAAGVLREQVARWVGDVVLERAERSGEHPVSALIVPHAGYQYSGQVAAAAYARLVGEAERIRRVVLIGPAHIVGVRGLALSAAEAFDTPVGAVPVDLAMVERLSALPFVCVQEAAHAPEHSLEVQLPFLLQVLREFSIVPLLAGAASEEQVAEVLDDAWRGADTIAVISSDLSHYLNEAEARDRDADTAAAIESLAADRIGPGDACGGCGIRGLLRAAHARGHTAHTVALRTSADADSSHERVVGYGAFVLRA